LAIPRNIRIRPVNNGSRHGFDIYLDFSGQWEYLMTYRHNGMLYDVLKDGIRLDDLKRLKPQRLPLTPSDWYRGRRHRSHVYLERTVNHLLACIDEYLADRALPA